MKHSTIDPLRTALRDLLTASEDYTAALSRKCVKVLVKGDHQTQADLIARAKELEQAHLQARGVLAEIAERLAETERETAPYLEHDDASDEARERASAISDEEIADRARRASNLFGGKP